MVGKIRYRFGMSRTSPEYSTYLRLNPEPSRAVGKSITCHKSCPVWMVRAYCLLQMRQTSLPGGGNLTPTSSELTPLWCCTGSGVVVELGRGRGSVGVVGIRGNIPCQIPTSMLGCITWHRSPCLCPGKIGSTEVRKPLLQRKQFSYCCACSGQAAQDFGLPEVILFFSFLNCLSTSLTKGLIKTKVTVVVELYSMKLWIIGDTFKSFKTKL